MKEYPILFTGPEVCATRDGTKTQTRRVIRPQPPIYWSVPPARMVDGMFTRYGDASDPDSIKCPHGQAGDRLWVKESHWRYGHWEKRGLTKLGRPRWRFVATDELPMRFDRPSVVPPDRTHVGYHKRSPLFMPKRFARLWLEVASVRVERVQGISEADVAAEGVVADRWDPPAGQWWTNGSALWCTGGDKSPLAGFARLWDSINAKRGYGWDLNPFVWTIEVKRIQS